VELTTGVKIIRLSKVKFEFETPLYCQPILSLKFYFNVIRHFSLSNVSVRFLYSACMLHKNHRGIAFYKLCVASICRYDWCRFGFRVLPDVEMCVIFLCFENVWCQNVGNTDQTHTVQITKSWSNIYREPPWKHIAIFTAGNSPLKKNLPLITCWLYTPLIRRILIRMIGFISSQLHIHS
jgi:hypothetical protein